MTSTLSLLHFNDVYRVTPQKISLHPPETIDVTQFTALLHDLRDQWALRDDGNRDGLVLFSGDVFSPSIESSVTRGSHMVIFAVHYSISGFDHGLCK
jgi:5'-nucleotidase